MTQPTRNDRATPTISSGSAYAAGDALGGKLQFTKLTQAGFGGVIANAGIIDLDSQNAELEIHFFEADFTPTTDNAAWDPSDADMQASWIGSIKVLASDYTTHADHSTASVPCNFPFRAPQGILYAQMRIASAKTWTGTSNLTVVLGAIPD